MRWEYKVVAFDAEHIKGDATGLEKLEVEINELGAADWELVVVLLLTDRSRGVGAVFKRPREGSTW